MLENTMNKVIKSGFGAVGFIALIAFLICAVPALFVWTVNHIAMAGGASFHLEHGVWNYFLVMLFLIMVRGGTN